MKQTHGGPLEAVNEGDTNRYGDYSFLTQNTLELEFYSVMLGQSFAMSAIKQLRTST